jgi:hypothetical protein
VIVDGDPDAGRFIAAYRTGDRLTGSLSAGMPPKAIRAWRSAIAARQQWSTPVGAASRDRRTG